MAFTNRNINLCHNEREGFFEKLKYVRFDSCKVEEIWITSICIYKCLNKQIITIFTGRVKSSKENIELFDPTICLRTLLLDDGQIRLCLDDPRLESTAGIRFLRKKEDRQRKRLIRPRLLWGPCRAEREGWIELISNCWCAWRRARCCRDLFRRWAQRFTRPKNGSLN